MCQDVRGLFVRMFSHEREKERARERDRTRRWGGREGEEAERGGKCV